MGILLSKAKTQDPEKQEEPCQICIMGLCGGACSPVFRLCVNNNFTFYVHAMLRCLWERIVGGIAADEDNIYISDGQMDKIGSSQTPGRCIMHRTTHTFHSFCPAFQSHAFLSGRAIHILAGVFTKDGSYLDSWGKSGSKDAGG